MHSNKKNPATVVMTVLLVLAVAAVAGVPVYLHYFDRSPMCVPHTAVEGQHCRTEVMTPAERDRKYGDD